MLTRSWTISRAHRFSGVLTVLLFVALAFAPVRLVGAYEEGKPAGSRSTRTPFSYLLFKKGETGSKGSVSMIDFDIIRKVKDTERRNPENLAYFRIHDDAWISRDPMVFAEVTAALEPIDRFEAKRLPLEERREELERERERLEERWELLQEKKAKLDERMNELEEGRDDDKSQRELAALKDDIETEEDALIEDRVKLAAEREAAARRYKALWGSEKAIWAEQDRVHQDVQMAIKKIAKRAIDDGRAEKLD